MTSISLEQAFESTFHNKYKFNEFLSINIDDNYKIDIHNNIFTPNKILLAYLKFLNTFVFNDLVINTNVVHSYRKNHNIYTTLTKHKNNKFFFRSDIVSFFSKINKASIENIISKNIRNSKINDIEKYHQFLLKMTCVCDVLPVGFPTSPNISNAYLYEFDNQFEKFCNTQKYTYTRYSDDIIVSSNSALKDIENTITNIFKKYSYDNLSLNTKKTRYLHKGEKIKLLGLNILPNGSISIDKKDKQIIECLIHFYINDEEKFLDLLKKAKLKSLSGKLNYINSVDKLYLIKLRKKYGNYIIDAIMHETIKI